VRAMLWRLTRWRGSRGARLRHRGPCGRGRPRPCARCCAT
jgi:hypothetical protein